MADAAKTKGNDAFKKKNSSVAIKFYTEAIELGVKEQKDGAFLATVYSNRSAAHSLDKSWEKALADADMATQSNPSYAKGFFRKGNAATELKDYETALIAYRKAASLETNNPDLMKKIEFVEPLAAKAEAARVSKMPPAEQARMEGNKLYKAAAYEEAVTYYTRALKLLDDKKSAEAVPVYNNRAACYQQLNLFAEILEDCSAVLEIEPANVKALIRRALAYENMEKPQKALDDFQRAVALEPSSKVALQGASRMREFIRRCT